jgi:uncharacterized protein
MKKESGQIIYSPSDLIRYLASPFASWLDRYHLEKPQEITPDEQTDEERVLSHAGDEHEQAVLDGYKASGCHLVEIANDENQFNQAQAATLAAIHERVPIIYQAALQDHSFAGYADFLAIDPLGKYQVWDTKLALSPKPYYPIQLCCYSEMLVAMTEHTLPDRIGIILGNAERFELRVEDFIHYYRQTKEGFLALQDAFTGSLNDCPEPLPRAEHGRWTSYAEKFFFEKDHLVQVAGISVGQIKKLRKAGIVTMTQLAAASGKPIHKLAADTLEKIVAQARLQCETRDVRNEDPDAKPRYEVLAQKGANGEPIGLATLPPVHAADVFFDMEGYPLVPGGLEYLFGTWTRNEQTGQFDFRDWWAHDRAEEKIAFEAFIDWIFTRWKNNPRLHIYHYASYECCAIRRLSTRHDTRQDEVDDLLRNNVFVDLYQVVRHALRIGEESYSLKTIEILYRAKRSTEIETASESIVQYANFMATGQAHDWRSSSILKAIRDYNEDDCRSTAELCDWLRELAKEYGIGHVNRRSSIAPEKPKAIDPKIAARQYLAAKLRAQGDLVSIVLADLVDFHRREQKPMWWKMFDRADASEDELRDDSACIQGIQAFGNCVTEKRSLLQSYQFDPSQECKLDEGDTVLFTHNLDATFTIAAMDADVGKLTLKIGKAGLDQKCQGVFPRSGSVLKNEYVNPGEIPDALSDVAAQHLANSLRLPVRSLLKRQAPANPLQKNGESPLDAALRIVGSMSGGCLVIQGPPGTGKTYTAACLIDTLLAAGKSVGVASNSHKAVVNLLAACGEAASRNGRKLSGIKVGDEPDERLHSANPGLNHVKVTSAARDEYSGGIVGGTAWLFSRPEWNDALDFLFVDEAGQVPLANAVAMSRATNNLVLLGDQMQLEQPVQGTHPGDAGLSALQYALKDIVRSKSDAAVFHAVVPTDLGLFLGESRRMHPNVCRFISESIYESRLGSIPECANQRIAIPVGGGLLVGVESGIVFSGIEHDGDIQQSDEEVQRVLSIFNEMLGRPFIDKGGSTNPLALNDFLFIAPYNAQVRALKSALPKAARVGSVDKFQGQEAAVCILSICSSFGEYGSRGLAFILNRSRINVAISRAKCLAVVVGDPRIAASPAGSITEMTLLNLYCKLVDETVRR